MDPREEGPKRQPQFRKTRSHPATTHPGLALTLVHRTASPASRHLALLVIYPQRVLILLVLELSENMSWGVSLQTLNLFTPQHLLMHPPSQNVTAQHK